MPSNDGDGYTDVQPERWAQKSHFIFFEIKIVGYFETSSCRTRYKLETLPLDPARLTTFLVRSTESINMFRWYGEAAHSCSLNNGQMFLEACCAFRALAIRSHSIGNTVQSVWMHLRRPLFYQAERDKLLWCSRLCFLSHRTSLWLSLLGIQKVSTLIRDWVAEIRNRMSKNNLQHPGR